MRKTAQYNLNQYLNAESKITLLIKNFPELQNINFKTLANEVNQ